MAGIGLGMGIAVVRRAPVASTPPPVPDGVLDTLTVPAAAAYSLRRLSKYHAGPAIRVRRSIDGAMSDIGFTPAGDLDVAALQAFVGSATGSVEVWFDQSSNGRNLSQPSMAAQPLVMDAGQPESVQPDSGPPGIRWMANQELFGTAVLAKADELTVAQVYREVSRQSGLSWSMTYGIAPVRAATPYSDDTVYFDVGYISDGETPAGRASFTPAPAMGTANVYTFVNSATLNTKGIFLNGVARASNQGSTAATNTLSLGNGQLALDSVFGEFVVFGAYLASSDQAALMASQGAYYGIPFTD